MIHKFEQFMNEHQYEPPEILADGRIHRFALNGKPRAKDAWYVLYANGPISAGAFGDWQSGEKYKWCEKSETSMTAKERQMYKQAMEHAKKLRDEAIKASRTAARKRANSIWQQAKAAGDGHPYLQSKGVPGYGLKLHQTTLVMPLVNLKGEITTLQFISDNGEKRLLTDGKKQGSFFEISGDTKKIYLAEGYATGASVHQTTRATTIVCCDAGNLKPVAEAIHSKYPRAEIVICADNDQWTDGNPGVTKAEQAAAAVDGIAIYPQFKDTTSKPTDFNDLQQLEGQSEVLRQITTRCDDDETLKTIEQACGMSEQLKFPYQVLVGAAGNFADIYSDYIESPLEFMFMSYLTFLGAFGGRLIHLQTEINTQPRLYTALVGESANTRKSTAIKKTSELFRSVTAGLFIANGLGSAEGFQQLLKPDEFTGVSPNLILCFDELKSFVSKATIRQSVLLPAVNELFENNTYSNAVKKSRVHFDDAHLSLLSASTLATYESIYDDSFKDIGFPNRIFLVVADAKRKYARPRPMSDQDRVAIKNDLMEVIKHIGTGITLDFTPEADQLYQDWYMNLDELGEKSVHARRLDTYSLRLMMLLAVNEKKSVIDSEVVNAAIDLCNWQLKLRQFYDPISADNTIAMTEQKIMRAVQQAGHMTKSELYRKIHASRVGQWIFKNALKNLVEAKVLMTAKKGRSEVVGIYVAPGATPPHLVQLKGEKV